MPIARADDLYGLPLEQFVSERAVLAKTLRGAGDRDEAARVAALRKPSAAAWTVNQLVRTQKKAVAELIEAGDQLVSTQSGLLAGRGDAKALRDAAQREREAVRKLTEIARGLLSSTGQEPTAATLERVSDTLHAAALDQDARAQVSDGSLVRELQHVGLGAAGFASAPAPRKHGRASEPKAAAPAPDAKERQSDVRAKAGAERAKAEAAKARLVAARRAEKQARQASDRMARAVEVAQGHRDRIAEQLTQAEAVLADASQRAEQAAAAHREAQQALERAE
jgi:hypothetical protein